MIHQSLQIMLLGQIIRNSKWLVNLKQLLKNLAEMQYGNV